MSELMVIFILITFVIPAICIIGDNAAWKSK